MADSLDIFTGILLTVIGLVLVYGSIIYRLIDLILIIGVLITIFGLYKLLTVFASRLLYSRNYRRNSRSRLNQRSNDPLSRVKESAKEVEDLVNAKLEGNNNNNSRSVLKSRGDNDSAGLDESSRTLDDFLNSAAPKEPTIKYDAPIDESKQVLKTKPVKEEKPKFKIPSIKKSNKPKKRSFGYLEKDPVESNPDTIYFTPNYEKPMKVTRRPRKKSAQTINLAAAPKRSNEISKALASVGDAETVYDNDVSDESYSLIPKTIDDEIILPIDEIDLDEALEDPVYNLSQSQNTLYNNVIYDEGEDDGVITPIYADAEYREEHGITDEDLGGYDDVDYPIADMGENGELGHITPSAEEFERPTSIASTNPIASKKEVGAYLTRPHRRSEVLDQPKPRAKEIPKPKPRVEEIPKPRAKEIPKVETMVEDIPRPAPKTITSDLEDVPDILEFGDTPEETITIDPNDPESLPIPKLLNSYVICEKGILTSQEAFEEVANHSKEEILLEAPTIKDMGERFFSSISKIKTRIIIQEFDLEDISYVLLLSSLIKKGVEIKTLASVDSFNLIGDTSHALIISNSLDENDFEYGAVYDDVESVENIKELFESSWNLAKDLDINAIVEK